MIDRPTSADPGGTCISRSRLVSRTSGTKLCSSESGWPRSTFTPRRRATQPIVVPWSSTDTSTAKNTTLKITGASGTPASSGKVASTIGTAPRSPAQDTISLSARVSGVQASAISTLTGRATNARNSATASPLPATGGSCEGKTSRPSVRNITICISQAVPSWKRTIERLWMKCRLPSTMPARYTARKPLPPTSAVAP